MQLTPTHRQSLLIAGLAAVLLLGVFALPTALAEEAAAPAEVTAVAPVADISATPVAATAPVLDRVRKSGKLTLGFRSDARPFSFAEAGQPAGYAVALCQQVADAVKSELALPGLAVAWLAVTAEDRFGDIERGKVDLLCGPDTVTLTRRETVSFSIAIFPGGVGALLRADAPSRLKQVLTEGAPPQRPLWRGSAEVLHQRDFAVVTGTTTESWLAERISAFKVLSKTTPVADYPTGVQRVIDGSSDVFFGDRAVLLDAATRSPNASDLMVLDRHFTVEPLALVLPRGDEDFRLAVDRALSRFYRSDAFPGVFAESFGPPAENARAFFRVTALPE